MGFFIFLFANFALRQFSWLFCPKSVFEQTVLDHTAESILIQIDSC